MRAVRPRKAKLSRGWVDVKFSTVPGSEQVKAQAVHVRDGGCDTEYTALRSPGSQKVCDALGPGPMAPDNWQSLLETFRREVAHLLED